MNFAWKVSAEFDQPLNQQIINQLNNSQNCIILVKFVGIFFDKYTHLASKASLKSKAVLRNMFRSLVNDESAPVSCNEGLVDERLAKCLLHMEDPDIILDT